MGFFQDLKEDLSLAVNELLPDAGVDEDSIDEQADEIIKETAIEIGDEIIGVSNSVAFKDDEINEELFRAAVERIDDNANSFAKELMDAAMYEEKEVAAPTLTIEQLIAAVEETTTEEVSEELAEEPVAEEVLEETATKEVAEEVLEEASKEVVDEEAAEEPVAEEVSEGPITEEAADEVLEEGSEEIPVEEATEAPVKEETVEESEEAATEEPVEEATVEETTVEEPVEEDAKEEEPIVADVDFAKEVCEEVMREDNKETELEKEVGQIMEERVESVMGQEVLDETAIVTKGMKVRGDIASQGSLDVLGSVNGNIEVLGKLNVSGSIEGNSNASEVFADAAHISGEIHAAGTVKVGLNSVIIGNIYASSAVIAGAVKGDIDVRGPVVLDSSAIVMGNIKSKSVQMNNGAVIEGLCSQCYADVNPTEFFKDL